MTRRTVLLLLSFLLAATGTGLLYAYVSHVDDRAIADQHPKSVLIVTKVVAQGTTVAEAEKAGDFKLQAIPGSAVADGALPDTATIRSLVALSPLYPGEQVLSQKFGQPGSSSSLSLPPGKIAVAVQLTDPGRVAGFVEPGSEVAVFATVDAKIAGAKEGQVTGTLLPRVTVLAVGPSSLSAGSSNDESLPKAIITLAVTQNQAVKLIYAVQNGDLYFGLLDNHSLVSTQNGVTSSNVFS